MALRLLFFLLVFLISEELDLLPQLLYQGVLFVFGIGRIWRWLGLAVQRLFELPVFLD